MKLNVSTNWDDGLLDELKNFREVKNILAQKPFHIPDSGQILCENARAEVEKHVKKAHDCGFEFTYVVDSTCLDNKEFETDKRKIITEFFQWVNRIEVDAVSLSSYILINMIKKYFPALKVGVNSRALVLVDDIAIASQYDQIGCDWVDINYSVNRDFERLKIIRHELGCEPRLTLQNLCIHNCPLATAHKNHLSHFPGTNDQQEDASDYYSSLCTLMYLEKPENFIKARWIRPEDLGLYEEIGYESFNIVDYSMPPTERIINAVNAYVNRKYDGNLTSLLAKDMSSVGSGYSNFIIIDNTKLSGFIDHFKKINCYYESCDDCGYCRELSDKVITYSDTRIKNDLIDNCQERIAEFER